jgi:uncharacterized protein YegJ (DUF2314 family)
MELNMRAIRHWLDDTKNHWAIAAIGFAVFGLVQAAVVNKWTIDGWPRPTILAAIAGIAFGTAIIAHKPWARWLGIPWVLLLGLVQVINATLSGWDLWDIIVCVILLLMAVAYYFVFFKPESGDEGEREKKPLLSLVLLLREPRYLDSTVLASLASQAWDIHVDGTPTSDEVERKDNSDEVDDQAFVVGEPPLFMAKHPSAWCLIHDFDRPYFDDPASAAEDVIEVRARNAILQHQAWISVDVVQWLGDGDSMSGAYRLIARLLAELADDNVLAVVDPDASKIYAYNPETERKLRSDNPLNELRTPYYVPVIAVPPDDSKMQAAVNEARLRWPEFLAAFVRRNADSSDHFLIKAPFGEGDHLEFMWMEVSSVENDVIYGILGNEPASIPDLREGDQVRSTVADINDWMYVVDGEPVGGFTLKVIAEQASRSKDSES